mmetsp:Transcript_2123/g.4554  ORF Transcript_2123/g.4554 Transcript_2123/m.4554 type:complete len:131 (+) Transcript_2123:1693-2085(+)
MGGSVEVCKWLQEQGIALNRKQRSGHTALHKAAENGHLEVCRFLLENLDDMQRARTALAPGEEALVDASSEIEKTSTDKPRADARRALESRLGSLSCEEMLQRRSAHLPSALATNHGHGLCAGVLRAASL